MDNKYEFRRRLAARARRFYTRFAVIDGQAGHYLLCPWCDRPIRGAGDLHEVFVKRGDVPLALQAKIFVEGNVVILHHDCHMEHGQTTTMERRCREYMKRYGQKPMKE